MREGERNRWGKLKGQNCLHAVENTAPNAFDSAKMGALIAGTGQRKSDEMNNGNPFED